MNVQKQNHFILEYPVPYQRENIGAELQPTGLSLRSRTQDRHLHEKILNLNLKKC